MTRILALASLGLAAACGGRNAALSPPDIQAVRAIDSAYVAAWMRDDTAGVMAVLAPDAVLMPAGHAPLTTAAAVRSFWWPSDGSHTKLLAFNRVLDDIGGAGNTAWVRGTDSISFTYEKDGRRSQQIARSMSLAVYEKDGGGQWRIRRMMWANRP